MRAFESSVAVLSDRLVLLIAAILATASASPATSQQPDAREMQNGVIVLRGEGPPPMTMPVPAPSPAGTPTDVFRVPNDYCKALGRSTRPRDMRLYAAACESTPR